MSAEVEEVEQKEDPLDQVIEEMEGDESEVKQTENPFENPLILANIFKYVNSIEDLKNIRLTNSLWLQESRKQWESLTIYWICSDVPISSRHRTCQERFVEETHYNERPITLKDFLTRWTLAEPRVRQCMKRFRLTNFQLRQPPTDMDAEERDFMRLLDLVGSNVTYLHLDHCTFRKSNYLRSIKWILSKCLKLQTLILILGEFGQEPPPEPLPEQLETLPMTKNLKSFSFLCCTEQQVVYHFQIPDEDLRHLLKISPNHSFYRRDFAIRVVMQANHQARPRQLANLFAEHFYRPDTVMEDVIGFIHNTFPTLKPIMFAFDQNNYVDSNLLRFLTNYQNSLKEMHITKECRTWTFSDFSLSKCRCFERGTRNLRLSLTHLHLIGDISVSFSSLIMTTNLKLLHIKSALTVNWNRIIMEDEHLPGVEQNFFEKLEEFYIDYFRLLPKSLRLLKKWMPNVKDLGVVVTPTTRPLVMELWPDLDKLVLVHESVLDEGGLPISIDVVQGQAVIGNPEGQ